MSETKHTFAAAALIAAFEPSMSKEIGGKVFQVDTTSIPDASIAYLTAYGFAQSMGDTKAVSALERVKAGIKAGVLPGHLNPDGDNALTTSNAAAALTAHLKGDAEATSAFTAWEASWLQERAQTRFDAIMAGDMVFGSSERLSPEEKDRRAITLDVLKTALSAKGLKMPKDTEEQKAYLAHAYKQREAEIEKEVARRAKVRASAATLDFSSFGG